MSRDAPIIRYDHLGLAVHSIERALVLYGDTFGGVFLSGGDDMRLGMRTVQLKLPGDLKIELLQPLDGNSHMAAFLERHGEGFHHATVLVPDVEVMIGKLTANGFELVDTDLSAATWRETFVRPKSGFGCLLQIVDSTLDWLAPHPTCTLEGVLAGEWRWWRNRTWHVDDLPDDYDGTRSDVYMPKTPGPG